MKWVYPSDVEGEETDTVFASDAQQPSLDDQQQSFSVPLVRKRGRPRKEYLSQMPKAVIKERTIQTRSLSSNIPVIND